MARFTPNYDRVKLTMKSILGVKGCPHDDRNATVKRFLKRTGTEIFGP